MDDQTLKRLGAKVTKVQVSYSRKIWGDIGGSLGAEVGMEADVTPEADYQTVANALYEAAREIAADNMRPALEAMQKPQIQPAGGKITGQEQPPEPKRPPLPPPAEEPVGGAPEPVRTPIDDNGKELIVMSVTSVAHTLTQNGDHVAKVFGSAGSQNLEVWGVRAWPEVMDGANIKGWDHWPICKSSKSGHEKENRFKCPYSKAFVEMSGGKAQRVARFE